MEATARREARPACKQRARHAGNGNTSLTPGMRDALAVFLAFFLALAFAFCVMGVTGSYNDGYVRGYTDAQQELAARHG